MTQEYTRTQMIDKVSKFFKRKGFHPEEYSGTLYNIRLPLYCVKSSGSKKDSDTQEEIAVDIITEAHISKDAYLPDKHFGEFLVRDASSVKFFQYYLPMAKVFWAYGQYVEENDDFLMFKKSCAENGIGLLKVSGSGVRVVQKPRSLKEILQKRVEAELSKITTEADGIIDAVSKIITDHQKEYIQYLVFYGEPRFTRRAITERTEDSSQFLSMLLINKLESLQNIAYAQQLKKFASEYRYASEDDHMLAFKCIQDLWKKRLRVVYPDILKDFEVVLLLNPKYRDHFLHQFQVFILGALIIDTLYSEIWVGQFKKKNRSKIEDAWLACSTYHDYNYPIQQWDDWMKRFLEQNFHTSSNERHLDHPDIGNQVKRLNLNEIVIRDEFVAKMRRLSAGLGCRFDDNLERFILQRIAADKNHAVLGAFTFLEKFQSGSKLSSHATNLAAVSILLHDEPNWQCLRGDTNALLECSHKDSAKALSSEERDICKKPILTDLTLSSMPLSFLLAYCDVAQEWGRQGRDFEIAQPRLEDIQIDGQKILVYLSVLKDISYIDKEKEITRLGHYLNDNRFEIKLSSREGQRESTKKMSGT